MSPNPWTDFQVQQRQRRIQEARRMQRTLRAQLPPEDHWRIRYEIAERLGVSARTASGYLAKPDSGRRRPRRDRVWTDERVKRAMLAWWERHGRPPRRRDWSPLQLRQHPVENTAERLAAFDAGWDDDGSWRRFPRADRIAFRRLLEEAARERDGGGSSPRGRIE